MLIFGKNVKRLTLLSLDLWPNIKNELYEDLTYIKLYRFYRIFWELSIRLEKLRIKKNHLFKVSTNEISDLNKCWMKYHTLCISR